jgi:hypothetical protein
MLHRAPAGNAIRTTGICHRESKGSMIKRTLAILAVLYKQRFDIRSVLFDAAFIRGATDRGAQ